MTAFQKIIQYLAIALAMLLCVSVIGGIVAALTGISFILSGEEKEPAGEMQVYSIEGEIASLSLNLSGAALKIKTADSFSVESNHRYLSVKTENGQLCINETKKPFPFSTKGVTIILSIPKDVVFDNATMDTGAGKVEIEALSADVLKLSLGAGKADIQTLTANSRADIDGGAGAVSIDGGKLCNLNLDMGVGKLTLKSRVEGKSDIDYGVGEANLILIGSKDDYTIELDKGIGEAKLEGESMNDDSVYGSGENRIEIDGGIGALSIHFLQDETHKAF